MALPSIIETWIWHRTDYGKSNHAWWALQGTALQQILLYADNLVGRYVRQHRRKALDLYRAMWANLIQARDRPGQVSAA